MVSRLQAPVTLDDHLPRLSALVAERLGLHFPPERFWDLARGLARAAEDAQSQDVAAYAAGLLSRTLTPDELHLLAGHLTIGETYFFREPATWDALRQRVLPGLIASRRGRDQRLRLWSAACASGEEAFSLAILVQQLIPDFPEWHVTILGTDINLRFLRRAAAGVYGDWSFRGTSPELRDRYFSRTTDGKYAIRDDLRRLVTFEHVNLVEDAVPSLSAETNAMDVILCRNVLMYFTPPQMDRVVDKLHRALVEGGWLVAGASEASHTRFGQFAVVNCAGATLFRKSAIAAGAAATRPVLHVSREPRPAVPPPPAARLQSPPAPPAPPASERVDYSLRARALANDGRLVEALAECDRWVASDRLFAPAHYIRAMILLEHGDDEAARLSLQRTLYLDPQFVLAHVALGSVARSAGDDRAAARHLANAQRLLAALPADALLPESDGLTAGRLAQTLAALAGVERSS